MSVSAYLFFKGDCAEALDVYARVFRTPAPDIRRFSDMPPGEMDLPPGSEDMVMHASIKVAGDEIMMSDNPGEAPPAMAGCSVMVSLPTDAEGRAAFDSLAEGGNVGMPYAPTFWSKGFGALVDRFGIRWMITTDEVP